MGILKRAAKKVAGKAEDAVLGKSEKGIQDAERYTNGGGKQ